MAQISFESSAQWAQNSYENSVGFFSLKNDKDFAIVRFLHDDTSSFDIQTTHDIKTADGKTRRVSCLRSNPSEPLDNCPLCKSGNATKTKLFIHMIQYTQNGPKGVVWERTLKYATELASLIKEYGPLSNCLFKVVRNGAAGDMKTTYSIMYAPPTAYPPEQYAYPEVDPFEDFHVCGTIIQDRTAEEMNTFIQTGNFPAKQGNQQAAPAAAQTFNQPVQNVAPQQYGQATDTLPFGQQAPQYNQYQAPQQQYGQYQAPPQYGAQQDAGFARPQRY